MPVFATTNVTTASSAWTAWTVTATSSSDNIWVQWTSACTDASVSMGNLARAIQPETEEQRQGREQRETEARVQREKEIREREVAKQKAEALLLSMLDPEQTKELQEKNSFVLVSELANRYRIRRGRSMNVDQLDTEGKKIATLCAHPREAVPDADTMVAQMLMLTNHEQDFLRVANRSPVRV